MTTVLCNAGPLIALGKLNRLELLAELHGQVCIPRAVYDEAVTQGLALGMPDAHNIRIFWPAKRWPIIPAIPNMIRSDVTHSVSGLTSQLAVRQVISEESPPAQRDSSLASRRNGC